MDLSRRFALALGTSSVFGRASELLQSCSETSLSYRSGSPPAHGPSDQEKPRKSVGTGQGAEDARFSVALQGHGLACLHGVTTDDLPFFLLWPCSEKYKDESSSPAKGKRAFSSRVFASLSSRRTRIVGCSTESAPARGIGVELPSLS